MKILLLLIMLSLISMGLTQISFAREFPSCPPLYGGGLVCQEAKDFRVDKKVQNPLDGQFIDSIPQDTLTFAPGQVIIYQILVINKTATTLRDIRVSDRLPSMTTFIRADRSVDADDGQIAYTINTLDADTTHSVRIEAKVADTAELPTDKKPYLQNLCVANVAEATLGQQRARDYISICVIPQGARETSADQKRPTFPDQTDQAKGGVMEPVKMQDKQQTKGGQTIYSPPKTGATPDTGPELVGLVALLPSILGGLWLRRKSSSH